MKLRIRIEGVIFYTLCLLKYSEDTSNLLHTFRRSVVDSCITYKLFIIQRRRRDGVEGKDLM